MSNINKASLEFTEYRGKFNKLFPFSIPTLSSAINIIRIWCLHFIAYRCQKCRILATLSGAAGSVPIVMYCRY